MCVDDDSYLGDFIADQSAISPGDEVCEHSLKKEILEVLETLNEREEKVIKFRFGIDRSQGLTLEEVGRKFGVTRERVRQIEAKALTRLRHPSRSKRLADFYYK